MCKNKLHVWNSEFTMMHVTIKSRALDFNRLIFLNQSFILCIAEAERYLQYYRDVLEVFSVL